jgi:hypothetical protein
VTGKIPFFISRVFDPTIAGTACKDNDFLTKAIDQVFLTSREKKDEADLRTDDRYISLPLFHFIVGNLGRSYSTVYRVRSQDWKPKKQGHEIWIFGLWKTTNKYRIAYWAIELVAQQAIPAGGDGEN